MITRPKDRPPATDARQQCAVCGRPIGWNDEVSLVGPVTCDPDEPVRIRHDGKSLARCRQRLGQ